VKLHQFLLFAGQRSPVDSFPRYRFSIHHGKKCLTIPVSGPSATARESIRPPRPVSTPGSAPHLAPSPHAARPASPAGSPGQRASSEQCRFCTVSPRPAFRSPHSPPCTAYPSQKYDLPHIRPRGLQRPFTQFFRQQVHKPVHDPEDLLGRLLGVRHLQCQRSQAG